MQRYQNVRGRALAFLLLVTFLWFMSFMTRAAFAPILPFVEDEFGVAHAKASSIFLVLSVGYSVSLLLAGFFASTIGLKKSIIGSMALGAVACFGIRFFGVFQLLYVSTLLIGVAAGLYLPSAVPLLTAHFEEKDWGKVLSIHDSGAGTCLFAGPLLITGLLTFVDWRGVFVAIAITMTFAAVAFSFLVEEPQGFAGKGLGLGGSFWRTKELWLLCAACSFVAGGGLGLYYVIPLYLVKELGMPLGKANTLFGVSRIGSIIAGIAIGFFVDRFSLKKTMLFLAFGAGFTTMLLATKNLTWIKALLVIQPCLVMPFMPACFLGVSRLFDNEARGQATAILITFGTVFGSGVIPYLLGLSGDLVSFRLGIFLLGACMVLSSFCILPCKRLQ